MKGFSVLVTVFLFALAAELASLLKQAGVSPADQETSKETLAADDHFTNGPARFARYESLPSSSSPFTE